MKCPNCNETLLMTERHNIEMDYCPNCRGVWLDKGELDKMLHHASQNVVAPQTEQRRDVTPFYYDQKHQRSHDQQKPHKKKSFLGDLFDFD